MKILCAITLIATAVSSALLPDPFLDKMGIQRGLSDEELVAETQRLWFQGAGGRERWEFDLRYEEMRDELIPFFEEMGYFNEIVPQNRHYDYALMVGATIWSAKKRICYLEQLLAEGLTVDRIVFFTGKRPLRAEEKALLKGGFETEADMMRQLYAESNLPRRIQVFFVEAPLQKKQTGWVRPQIADIIPLWLEANPAAGSCVAISTQPFARYQGAIVQRLLPPEFPCDIAAEKIGDVWSVALVLDSIARNLYEQTRSCQ